MTGSAWREVGCGITCVDAGYVEPGLACLYLVEEGEECAVLETGTQHSIPILQQLLAAKGIEPRQVRYVIPTHVHLDHAGGAGGMMQVFPQAELLIHPRGARHMADPTKLVAAATAVYGATAMAEMYGDIVPVAAARIRQMADGETVTLAGRSLEFRHTRGHAEHHCCVWDAASRGWFSGDMFGLCYPWLRFKRADFVLPSTTPSQFDPDAFLASLRLLAGYGPERLYLTHYGDIAWSDDKAELLSRQVCRYRELALAADGDGAGLEQSLTDYTLEQLAAVAGDVAAAELRQKLAMDMRLNAQGLHLWRAGQA